MKNTVTEYLHRGIGNQIKNVLHSWLTQFKRIVSGLTLESWSGSDQILLEAKQLFALDLSETEMSRKIDFISILIFLFFQGNEN